MTRQALIFKWFIYGLGLVPVWFLETAVLRRLPLLGVFPVLLPMAAVAVAVLEGPVSGAGFGLAVGVLCDAVYYGANGSMTIALALIGAAAGLVTQYALQENYWGFLLCSAGALAAVDALRMLRRLFLGTAPFLPMLRVALPEILWSLVFSPIVYFIFRSAYRRVGGTALM